MKKAHIDVYSSPNIYSSSQLREHYRHIKRCRRMLASIPVVLLLPSAIIYGLISWGEIFVLLEYHVNILSSLDFIDFIIFAFCGALYSVEKKNSPLYAFVLMLLYTLAKCITDKAFHIIPISMCVYLAATSIIQYFLTKEMLYMRTLPQYPFSDRNEAEKINDEVCKQIRLKNPERTDREAYSGDENQTEKLMDMLPKLSRKAYLLKKDEFDDPDSEYFDDVNMSEKYRKMSKLERKYSQKDRFCDMDELDIRYKGDIGKSNPGEYIEFEELNIKFKGDIKKSSVSEYAEIEDLNDMTLE